MMDEKSEDSVMNPGMGDTESDGGDESGESAAAAGRGKASGQNVRERIVGEAIGLFCGKGYEATSVREIVKAAGVTKPVLYYYFKNKEALFRHIIESSLAFFKESMEAACSRPNADYGDQLRVVAEIYLEMGRADPVRARFLHAIAFSGLYDDVFNFMDYWNAIFEHVKDFFRRGKEAGFFRADFSSEELARHFIGIAESAMRGIIYCPERFECQPSSEGIVEIILNGVGAREGEKAPRAGESHRSPSPREREGLREGMEQ